MAFQSDFSRGTRGWRGLAYGSGLAEGAGWKGGNCLRLVQPADKPAINVTCEPFAVMPGRRYQVSARVRLIHPQRAGYKVTVDWLDAAGQHIAYSNDWTGNALGADWDLHTAFVTAPAEARRALIILGVTSGAEMLFDAIRVDRISDAIDVRTFGADHPMPQVGQRVILKAVVVNRSGEPLRTVRGVFRCGSEALPAQAAPQTDGSVELLATWRPKEPGAVRMSLEVTASGVPRSKTACRIRVCARTLRDMSLSSGWGRLTALSDLHGGVGLRLSVSGVTRALLPGPVWLQLAEQGELAPLQLTWRKSGADLVGVVRHEALKGELRLRSAGNGWFDASLMLQAKRPVSLYGLLFPRVHASGPHRSALLPGLEYLTASEMSSGLDSCSADCADRYLPHPFKMTLPLAAIERDGYAVGLTYTPISRTEAPAPSPVFAVPDRLMASAGGLMALIWPSVGPQRTENSLKPESPLPMKTGARFTVSCGLFVLPASDDVSRILPVVMRRMPAPTPDPVGDTDDRWHQSVADTRWAWDQEKLGWRREAHHTQWVRDPAICAALLNYALNRPGPEASTYTEQAMSVLAQVTDNWTNPGAAGPATLLQLGKAEHAVYTLFADPVPWLRSQQPDGSWVFRPRAPQEVGLGREGATDLGICAEPARHLLDIALNSGRSDALDAGIKAIAFMRQRFRRPAGGETWEVPLHAPNLRAAALACDCGVFAWQMTGKPEHLEFARYWATTGLPFIYGWQAPDRPGLRYATVSVFGATFFTMPWFGKPVQWVGLVYADALRRLARYDASLPWLKIAEGILFSAIHQCDLARRPEAGCPWPGALPDSYDVVKNVVNAAWIGPWQIIDQLAETSGAPVLSRLAHRTNGQWITLLSALPVTRWDVTGEGSRIELHGRTGSSFGLLMRGVPEPAAVRWNGKRLARTPQGIGWSWHETVSSIAVNLTAQRAQGRLEIDWQ